MRPEPLLEVREQAPEPGSQDVGEARTGCLRCDDQQPVGAREQSLDVLGVGDLRHKARMLTP